MNAPLAPASEVDKALTQVISWTDRLRAGLGDELLSVTLFGGLARGEFIPMRSDVNVMTVVRHAPLQLLERLVPYAREGEREFNLSLLLSTEADLAHLPEIFPVKFLDMQKNRRVLFGKDYAAEWKIDASQLRFRCRQELCNLLLRLRHFYLEREHRPELIEFTLSKAASSLLANLAVLIELHHPGKWTSNLSLLREAEQLGIPTQPVSEALALKRDELNPGPAGIKQLFGEFLKTVEAAAKAAGDTAPLRRSDDPLP